MEDRWKFKSLHPSLNPRSQPLRTDRLDLAAIVEAASNEAAIEAVKGVARPLAEAAVVQEVAEAGVAEAEVAFRRRTTTATATTIPTAIPTAPEAADAEEADAEEAAEALPGLQSPRKSLTNNWMLTIAKWTWNDRAELFMPSFVKNFPRIISKHVQTFFNHSCSFVSLMCSFVSLSFDHHTVLAESNVCHLINLFMCL